MGDRVAPYKPIMEKRLAGLPRAAPLVQPGRTSFEPKRTRVAMIQPLDPLPPPGSKPQPVKPLTTRPGEGPQPSGTAEQHMQVRSRFVDANETDGKPRRAAAAAARDAYGKLAKEKCAEAIAAAQAKADARKANVKRPPGVWWGFHYFWPKDELLNAGMKSAGGDDVLDDPQFLRRVQLLMGNDRVIETFSIFDVDGSGSIEAKELRPLVQMVVPNPNPKIVEDMVASLDINQDGEVDLWEFCVAIQKRSEGLSEADLALEIDEAFRLFDDNGDGWVDEAELRRIMQDPHTGSSLSEDEFMFFLDDLERHQMFIRNGGKLKLAVLRQHPFLS